MGGSLETLEFIIHADGRVEERVTGVVGASCAEVTAAIEAQLGRVVKQEKTSDFYTQEVQQASVVSSHTHFSEW
jgi:hypothetical protein